MKKLIYHYSPINIFIFIHLLDEENGQEAIEKGCGEPERNNFEYNDGCETTKIPFKSKECYCKTSLCNGAPQLVFFTSGVKIVLSWIFIHFLARYS